MNDQRTDVLELFRSRVLGLARHHGLTTEHVEVVSARPLTSDEAIGKPERGDFPLLKGKEFMMEARFLDCRGHAFTASPGQFEGTVEEILDRDLDTDFDRALAVATANAILAHLGLVEKTAHCRDDGPGRCASHIADYLRERFHSPRLAIIGYQPAMIAALVPQFDVRVTDMDPENVGREQAGALIEGAEKTPEVLDWADVVLVTGTTLANDTIESVMSDKPTVFYGVTIAGAAALFGYERYCPYGTA